MNTSIQGWKLIGFTKSTCVRFKPSRRTEKNEFGFYYASDHEIKWKFDHDNYKWQCLQQRSGK